MANRLQHETSPYLLQHQNNPVDWFPWGEEALKKAQEENKPILVSIGYSACHWCHVMEHQSFEKDNIAEIMNEHVISIKIDREERPDIDQIYMDAVQAMGIRGGWPLNVFCTPDGKPFYGGTYYPANQWADLVQKVSAAWKENKEQLINSANGFVESLSTKEVHKYGLAAKEENFNKDELNKMFRVLQPHFDVQLGGMDREPKFPMPAIWLFLLRYYAITKNDEALQQVKLTLNKMAWGGIYDQIGGGFARYSTDVNWFIPHFEKMLYDNGQLVSLFSEAWTLTHDDEYKRIVSDTINWLEWEMTSAEGGFYSAQDADSEGIEGKFYLWKDEDLKKLLKDDAKLFSEYYNCTEEGNWEHESNVLIRSLSNKAFAKKNGLSVEELESKVEQWKETLLEVRNLRIFPGLDDKVLASWNGIMLKGLTDAYRAFGEERYLNLARRNAEFLLSQMKQGDRLFHSWKKGKAKHEGFLEDYAFVVQGLIGMYEVTFEERWLDEAGLLCNEVIDHFLDPEDHLFFFTSDRSEKLIARKKELFDNVIPASNSVMAMNLWHIGTLTANESWVDQADHMLKTMLKIVKADPSFTCNWARLYTLKAAPAAEVAITGLQAEEKRKALEQTYIPHKIIAGTKTGSKIALLRDRTPDKYNTLIHVCYGNTCQLPVERVEDAVKNIEQATLDV
jgi:uncharacterized protein YyaL (SSP411 family)